MNQSNSTSIYRQEAVNAHFTQQYGQVLLLPRLNHRILFWCIICLVTVGLVFISTQPFYDTIEAKGWIDTNNANIDVRSKEAAGIIQSVYVDNGQAIKAGQAIAKVKRSRGDALGTNETSARRLRVQQEYEQQRQIQIQKERNLNNQFTNLLKRQKTLTTQLKELQSHRLQQTTQINIHKVRLVSLNSLLEKGLVSKLQVEQSETQLLNLKHTQFELFSQQQSIQIQLDDIAQAQHEIDVTKQQLQHELNLISIKSQSALSQLNEQIEYTVIAPVDGLVSNMQIQAGDSLQFNQIISQIAPANPQFIVQLAINAQQIGNVEVGQSIQLKIDGFPYQKFGSVPGTIIQIAEKVLLPKDIHQLAIALHQPVYLVRVALNSPSKNARLQHNQFRSGMTVQASIVQHESTILMWFLAPLVDSLSFLQGAK